MAVDLSPIDESLLAEIANIHGMPKGAFNIRKDGELVEEGGHDELMAARGEYARLFTAQSQWYQR